MRTDPTDRADRNSLSFKAQKPFIGKEDVADVVDVVQQWTISKIASQAETESAYLSECWDKESKETGMPPPKLPYNRSDRQLIPTLANSLLHQSPGTVARARSSSPPKHEQLAKEFLRSRCMTMSLQSLDSSRWSHNKAIGIEILSRHSVCGCYPVEAQRQERIDEFDLLLKDL
jgi:hypothetical protein